MADYGDLNLVKRELSFGGSSKVQWTPTAARTIQLPNKSGTIALLDDLSSGTAVIGLSPRWDLLSIATANTVPNLAASPAANTQVLLVIEGVVESSLGTNPAFVVSGQAITWSAANAGYALPVGARVIALYWVSTTGNTISIRSSTLPSTRPGGTALASGDIWLDESYWEFNNIQEWVFNQFVAGVQVNRWFLNVLLKESFFKSDSIAAGTHSVGIFNVLSTPTYFDINLVKLGICFNSSAVHNSTNYAEFRLYRVSGSGVKTSIYSFTSLQLNPVPGAGHYNISYRDNSYKVFLSNPAIIDTVATGFNHFELELVVYGSLQMSQISTSIQFYYVARSGGYAA